MKTDQRIIDVDDDIRADDRPQETPVISIGETPDEPVSRLPSIIFEERKTEKWKGKRKRRFLWTLIAVACVVAAGTLIWMNRYSLLPMDVTSSVSDKENIEILREGITSPATGTTITYDSVLGVAFDMYSLAGLKGSLEREIPDTADRSLALFMRSADYHPDGSMLGTVVIDGEKIPAKERKSRPGYVALSKDGATTIGISLSDKMAENAQKNEGSFFRQYVLLGDGELPSRFELHGKVERAALGRMADGELYYVVSRHKETMYDFADALREYGFTDAIYLTGGNNYAFSRDKNGTVRIPASTKEKIDKYNSQPSPTPFLVFRKLKTEN